MQRLRVCLVACLLGFATGATEEEETVTVRPGDNGAALANSGMGWVFHYYDNVPAHYGSKLDPSDTLDDWPGLTVIYLRIPWSYIEPEEGKFHWSVLDTPAQRWIAKGKQVAFRITASEVMQYAAEHGLTLRDDSILVQPGKRAYFHAAWAKAFWPRVPVILESEHYGGSKARGCWQDGSLYLKAIEQYHASYASIHWWPREFLQENRELVRRINLRLG